MVSRVHAGPHSPTESDGSGLPAARYLATIMVPAEGQGGGGAAAAVVLAGTSGAAGGAGGSSTGGAAARGGSAAAALDWSGVFRDRGAAVDLAAVAQGGGEQVLEWALGQLPGAAAGLPPQPLSCRAFAAVLCSGNWAAADWLLARGLAPTGQPHQLHQLFAPLAPHMGKTGLVCGIPALRWIVSRCGLRWTAKCRAPLVKLLERLAQGQLAVFVAPGQLRWLEEMVAAVDAALGGPLPTSEDGG
ncbi:hypothetical protein HYH02_008151 [Chlamydomonas schloesseri]|uniref:Uncharacterized protein n=1 Tax=Chlamydomonas schloesseri TaxID=2026947 RepID=A0A835WGC6_9CHLO|nr:hypothetical protein HYH02_008151 [Chlamydomonas schloesseri]|eukprot:KAG2446997.1 hypothetical protein HYH02_008151 [Chlamydomonas schloesseri]